jgi:hypothetical protein
MNYTVSIVRCFSTWVFFALHDFPCSSVQPLQASTYIFANLSRLCFDFLLAIFGVVTARVGTRICVTLYACLSFVHAYCSQEQPIFTASCINIGPSLSPSPMHVTSFLTAFWKVSSPGSPTGANCRFLFTQYCMRKTAEVTLQKTTATSNPVRRGGRSCL